MESGIAVVVGEVEAGHGERKAAVERKMRIWFCGCY